MSELPVGWATTTLGEVATETVSQGGPALGQEVFTYVDIGSIDRESKRISTPQLLESSKAPSRAKQRLIAGDVLVSMTRPNLNAVTMVPDGLVGSVGSTGFRVLRTRFVSPTWLGYRVQSSDFVSAMSMKVQGALYPAVRPADIDQFEISLPPRREQDRIIAEVEQQFTRLDAATRALKRAQANLKRYRASVLKAACEGRLVPTEAELARNENHDYEPADKLLERILRERRARWEANTLAKMIVSGKPPKDDSWKQKYEEPVTPRTSDLPSLPEGWSWTNLSQLKLFSLYGPRFSSDDYTPDGVVVLRTTDISSAGKVDMLSAPRLQLTEADLEKYHLRPGDLVFTRTGATVGKLAIFDDDVQAIPGAYLIHYRTVFGESLPWYVYRFFQTQVGQDALLRGTRGIGQPNLNAPTIESIPIPLPPWHEQGRILLALDQVLSISGKQEEVVEIAQRNGGRLRNAVLQSAFIGKLVPQCPTDEPASALLERIRTEPSLVMTKITRHSKKRSTHV